MWNTELFKIIQAPLMVNLESQHFESPHFIMQLIYNQKRLQIKRLD